MNMENLTKDKIMEICCECGKSVKGGSGRFVNRVPNLNTEQENIENGVPFPKGEYYCAECDERTTDE